MKRDDLFFISCVLFVVGSCLYLRLHFSDSDVIGRYRQQGTGAGSATVEVRKDGSFVRTDRSGKHLGRWSLTDNFSLLYDPGIELDATEPDQLSNDYVLTRRGFKVCWVVQVQVEYWCKESPWW